MNLRAILYVLGQVCQAEAAFLLLPMICALCYQEYRVALIYFLVALLCLGLGFLMTYGRKSVGRFRAREGMAATGLAWILMSILGSLPFILAGEIPNPVDAFFETVSGFTTTGSTIIPDLSTISHGSLFWRSFTHWIGGMGVLVFLLALLPSTSAKFMNLMIAESPGPDVSKLVPKVKDTAKTLYVMYIGLTLIQIVFLLLAGMPLFGTLCLTMGTAGTGGFAVRANGFDDYTMLQQGIIAIFMMLFGINFSFYFLLLRHKWKQAFHMEEVLTYIGIILVVTFVIVLSVRGMFPDIWQAIHHVFFTVSSLITTTGYATVDFNLWTPLARTLLVMIMFIGACAGSTDGGIKVSRFNVMIKGIKKEFRNLLHPGLVEKVQMDGKPIAHETVRSINVFLSIYLIVFVSVLLIITIDGKNLVTNFTAVAATINNIGPGLSDVGPMSTFAGFSNLSKLALSFAMLAGRLELLPIILLMVPAMWRGTHRITKRDLSERKEEREKAHSKKEEPDSVWASEEQNSADSRPTPPPVRKHVRTPEEEDDPEVAPRRRSRRIAVETLFS